MNERDIRNWLGTLDEYGHDDGNWIPNKKSMKELLELALKGIAPVAEVAAIGILRAWTKARPGDDRPYIAACELLERLDMNSPRSEEK